MFKFIEANLKIPEDPHLPELDSIPTGLGATKQVKAL